MKYTDVVPTIPGYYWERGYGCVRILQLPHCKQWPTHWRKRKADTIKACLEDGDEDIAKKLAAQSDKSWKVEWAGPILPPE